MDVYRHQLLKLFFLTHTLNSQRSVKVQRSIGHCFNELNLAQKGTYNLLCAMCFFTASLTTSAQCFAAHCFITGERWDNFLPHFHPRTPVTTQCTVRHYAQAVKEAIKTTHCTKNTQLVSKLFFFQHMIEHTLDVSSYIFLSCKNIICHVPEQLTDNVTQTETLAFA